MTSEVTSEAAHRSLLLLLLDLALVVVLVVADPVPGDGGGEHAVRDGERVADVERVRAQIGAEGGGAGAHLRRLKWRFSGSERPLNGAADKRPYRCGRYVTVITVSI